MEFKLFGLRISITKHDWPDDKEIINHARKLVNVYNKKWVDSTEGKIFTIRKLRQDFFDKYPVFFSNDENRWKNALLSLGGAKELIERINGDRR